jgi:Cytochrome c554 and c-prime
VAAEIVPMLLIGRAISKMRFIRRTSCTFWVVFLLAFWVAGCRGMVAQAGLPEGISLPTELRMQETRGWWPTKGTAAREDYVGNAECARCHASTVATYQTTAMAQTGMRASDSQILREHGNLAFRAGEYSYQLETEEGKSTLKVSHEKSSISQALHWAVGIGYMGQTYLYQRGDDFYEDHLSFYSAPQALDITPGQSGATPQSLVAAAGRRMSAEETRHCFACHTTASTTAATTGDRFDPNLAFAGVTCEACHGPGATHVAAAKSGIEALAAGSILNPKRLDRVASVDFCGACHRTWEDVVVNGQTGLGVFNVRFAPYRLENSKCWKQGDARITCVACHDPHQPLARDSGSYDERCVACHLDGPGKKRDAEHPGAACPVSQKNCVTCHMPPVEPPGLHSVFADHWIRIVGKGTPYPD